MNRFDRLRFCVSNGRVLQDTQHLHHTDSPGTGRRHATERHLLPVHTEGFAAQRTVLHQIGHRQIARNRVGGNGGHHILSKLTLIESLCALAGQQAQHLRVFLVLQTMADGPGLALFVQKIGTCSSLVSQFGIIGNQGIQTRADLEADLGKLNRRVKQIRPRQHATIFMHQLQGTQQTRYAYRTTTIDRLFEGHGFTVQLEAIQTAGCRHRFPSVIAHQAGLGLEHQQEAATANTGGLWLHQP